MAAKTSNGSSNINSRCNILEELRNGVANFEIVSSPVTSIATNNHVFWMNYSVQSVFVTDRFFVRVGPKLEVSPALSKVETFKVHKVTGDGRCMFRAVVYELRMAIKEVLCDSDKGRHQYEEALRAITIDEPLKRCCQHIGRPDFWAGESELLQSTRKMIEEGLALGVGMMVLSKLCHQPMVVYIPEHEHSRAGNRYGFILIAEYGADFGKGSRKVKPRKL